MRLFVNVLNSFFSDADLELREMGPWLEQQKLREAEERDREKEHKPNGGKDSKAQPTTRLRELQLRAKPRVPTYEEEPWWEP